MPLTLHDMALMVAWAYDSVGTDSPFPTWETLVDARGSDVLEQHVILRHKGDGTRMLVIPGTQDIHDALLPDGDAGIIKLLDLEAVPMDIGDGIQVHRGAHRVVSWLLQSTSVRNCHFVIGHSLGAAAAAGVAQELRIPGVGFAPLRYYHGGGPADMAGRFLSVVRIDDIVPNLPPGRWSLPGTVRQLPETLGATVLERHAIEGYAALLEQEDADGRPTG